MIPHDTRKAHHTDAQYSTPLEEKIFSFGKKSNILSAMAAVKVEGHQFLEGQDHMAEEGVGQAARQRLLGAVHHEHNIRHLGQRGVAPLGEGDDLMAVLAGVAHVVQYGRRLSALADGEHYRRCVRAVRQVMGVAEQHIVVEVHIIEYHKAADGQPLGNIGAHDVGEPLAGGEQLGRAGTVQKLTEAGDELVRVIVDQAFQAFRAAAPTVRGELAAEVVVQLTVSVEAQPLAHLHDRGGGEKVLVGDLLDAHPLFTPLDMGGDAGDHLFFILRKQICQQKIAVAHSASLLIAVSICFSYYNKPRDVLQYSAREINRAVKAEAHNASPLMLKNIKYTGCMVNHTRESMVIRAKSQRRVPKEDWIYHENAHEAIVTTEEFEVAQAALRKVKPHIKKKAENFFPFYCAHCGRKLQRTFDTDVHFYCWQS